MYGDISEYLVDKNERDLRTRLLTDYKDGKGFSYFDSKWLKEVFYHHVSEESDYCFLKSKCCPSMKITHEPHDVWVCINKRTGKIQSGYCSCFAGLGATCNHVAAVLFKLDFAWQKGYTNKACTSLPATWTAPSKSKTVLEPKRITEMEWRKPHYKKHGAKKAINPAARRLFSPRKPQDTGVSLEALMGSLYVSCSTASVFHYATPHILPSYPAESDLNLAGEVDVHTTHRAPPPLRDLLCVRDGKPVDTLPAFSSGEVEALELVTRDQSRSQVWVDQRVGRITSSTAHRALAKARKLDRKQDPGNMKNFVDVVMGRNPPDPNLPNLKFGREMEPEARQKYTLVLAEKGHKDVRVQECGFYVHKRLVFMGASPDGLVSCSCCGLGLVEIKCPISVAHMDPQECPPSYISRAEDNSLTLKASHGYFSQVVMHLAVTGYDWCDFFVYTVHGHFIQRISKSDVVDRIRELEEASEQLFFDYLVPELQSSETSEDLRDDPVQSADKGTSNSSTDFKDQRPEDRPIELDDEAAQTDETVAPSTSYIPPLKKARSSKRRQKATRTKTGPVYVCESCQEPCKSAAHISTDDDYSVGCDSCFKWYHWGCVGFDGSDRGEWLCPNCE